MLDMQARTEHEVIRALGEDDENNEETPDSSNNGDGENTIPNGNDDGNASFGVRDSDFL